MNKFLEYLKLLPKVKDPLLVIEGHVNNIKLKHGSLPEDAQEEILKRRLICSTCPYNSKNKEGAKDKGFDYCTLCSCPLLEKTAALGAECGAGIYNPRHPEDQKPLLWGRYKDY